MMIEDVWSTIMTRCMISWWYYDYYDDIMEYNYDDLLH